jgi:di/tricarboxylate transporter
MAAGPAGTGEGARSSALKLVSAGLVVAVAAWLALVPGSAGLTPSLGLAAGLTVFTIGFWATGAVPEYLTSVTFLAAAMILGAAPASVIFSGFAATAFWLVFAGVILGGAVNRTGLGERLAAVMVTRLASSYARTVAGVILVTAILGFLLPSTMGRVVLLIPIILALSDRLGLAAGRTGRIGLVLAAGLSAYHLGVPILPANVPNMVLAGAAETLLDVQLTYASYWLYHFPVLGILKGVVIWLAIVWLFPDRLDGSDGPADAATPANGHQMRLTVILLVTLGLWATDVVHGISPAWVGLAAALICLWPRVGVLDGAGLRGFDLAPVFYVGGMLGLVALVAHSGLGDVVSHLLLGSLPIAPGADVANFVSLSLLGTMIAIVTTLPGVPTVLTPLAPELSGATGWPVDSVIMTQIVSFATPILPHQSPPLMVALALAGVGIRAATRSLLAVAGLTVLLLWPLTYLWWHVVGLIPGPGG